MGDKSTQFLTSLSLYGCQAVQPSRRVRFTVRCRFRRQLVSPSTAMVISQCLQIGDRFESTERAAIGIDFWQPPAFHIYISFYWSNSVFVVTRDIIHTGHLQYMRKILLPKRSNRHFGRKFD